MSTQLKLTIVGDPQPLRTATKQAEMSLRRMQKVTKTVGDSMNKTLGTLGVGLGFAALTNGLKNATKAASEDRKSQGLLANALQNTVGATDGAIAGAEQYIKKTQLSSAVLDDELRPALANTVRATGSLASGQRLLDIALDISASTGKDLGSVTGALSKQFNGNATALKKLIPGIQLTDNWMGELETKFQGASETAANLDPYKRLEVIFADIQETIGTALLPALEEFATYLASTEGQQNVRQIVDLFVAMGTAIGNVITFLVRNIQLVKLVVAEVVLLKFAWLIVNGIMKLYEIGVLKAVTATKLLKFALVSTGLGAIAVAVGSIAAAWLETTENTEDAQESATDYLQDPAIIAAIAETNRMRDELLANEAERIRLLTEKKDKAVKAAKDLADSIRKALDSKIDAMKKTGEKFRDAVGIAFGVFGEDEYSVFNEDVLISKLKRMVAAAKGFAENIKKLRDQKADEGLIDELVGMGPAQGNIVAQGLLNGGKLSEILGLRKSLYGTGTQVGAQQALAGNATYEININKAVITASDIIKEIKALEKKTGRKYLVG